MEIYKKEVEKSKEDIEKEIVAKQKEWETFIEGLKSNPKGMVTNADFLNVIEVLTDNMGGMAQMINVLMQNTSTLNHNLQQIAGAIGMTGGPAPVNKTKSGIILP